MIIEFLIDCIFGIANGFFELLPDITWDVDTNAWQYGKDIIDMIAYLLPLDAIKNVIATIFTVTCVRIVISFLRTIMGFIPFV